MKLVTLKIILIINLLYCHSQSASKNEINNNYKLNFGGIGDRTVLITANIYIVGDELNMVSRPKRFMPDISSWWDIITVKKIEDKNGRHNGIRTISGNTAKLYHKVNGMLKITYSLDISYVDKDYPNLNTAVGKSFDEGLFIIGKPLFIFGDPNLKTIVEISNPKEVKITVPWNGTSNNAYSSENLRELVLSNVIISNHTIGVKDFSIGKLSYSLATFGLENSATKLINQIANDIAHYYVITFPFDHSIRYVQLVYGVPGMNGGGEAYPYSSASAISKNNLENSFMWKITVFHELFHMWNSHMLKGVAGNSEMEWFQEGFTDYMTERALLKTKHIDSSTLSSFQKRSLEPLKRKLENNDKNLSIKSSGANKGKNYIVVYRGGWLIADWLDKRLKSKANENWNVERLFNHLLKKYPPNKENKLNIEAFLIEISKIDPQISKDLEIILNSQNWSTIKNILMK